MAPLTPEQVAYERGKEEGRIESRVDYLESGHKETTQALTEVSRLVTSLTTTVKLLDRDITNRAETDKQNQELRDQNTKDIAKAVKDVVDATALAATKTREDLARSLVDENAKTSIKWTPRMGWLNFAILALAVGTAVYKVFHP